MSLAQHTDSVVGTNQVGVKETSYQCSSWENYPDPTDSVLYPTVDNSFDGQ